MKYHCNIFSIFLGIHNPRNITEVLSLYTLVHYALLFHWDNRWCQLKDATLPCLVLINAKVVESFFTFISFWGFSLICSFPLYTRLSWNEDASCKFKANKHTQMNIFIMINCTSSKKIVGWILYVSSMWLNHTVENEVVKNCCASKYFYRK